MAEAGSGRRAGLTTTLSTTFVRQVVAAGLQLVTALVLARALGATEYGRYAAALLVPKTLSAIIAAGLPTSLAYFSAREPASFAFIVRIAVRFWLVSSLLAVAVSALLFVNFGDRLFPGVGDGLLWLALASFPPMHLATLFNGLIQGVQAFRALNASLLVAPTVTALMVFVIVILLGGTTYEALAVWAFGQLAGGVASAAAVFGSWRRRRGTDARLPARELWAYGSVTHASAIMASLRHRVAHYLVLVLAGPAATGIYSLAAQLAEKIWLLPQAVQTVLLPVLTGKGESQSRREQTVTVSTRIILLACFAASAALWLVVALFGRQVFGPSFEGIVAPLAVLLAGTSIHSITRTLGTYFAATNRPGINIRLSAVGLVAVVGSGLVLVPALGTVGAALASTAAYVLPSLFAIYYFAEGRRESFGLFRPRLSDLGLVLRALQSGLSRRGRAGGSAV